MKEKGDGVSLQARAEAEKKAVPAAGGGLKKPGGSGFKLAAAVRHVPPCQEAHEISSACHALIPECDSRTSACHVPIVILLPLLALI